MKKFFCWLSISVISFSIPATRASASWRQSFQQRTQGIQDRVRDTTQRTQESIRSTGDRVRQSTQDAQRRVQQETEAARRRAQEAQRRAQQEAEAARRRAQEAQRRVQQEAEAARRRAQEAQRRVQQETEAARQRTRERAQEVERRTRQAADTARQRTQEVQQRTREQVRRTGESLSSRARQTGETIRESVTRTRESIDRLNRKEAAAAAQRREAVRAAAGNISSRVDSYRRQILQRLPRSGTGEIDREKVADAAVQTFVFFNKFDSRKKELTKEAIQLASRKIMVKDQDGRMTNLEDFTKKWIVSNAPSLAGTSIAEDPAEALTYCIIYRDMSYVMNDMKLIKNSEGEYVSMTTGLAKSSSLNPTSILKIIELSDGFNTLANPSTGFENTLDAAQVLQNANQIRVSGDLFGR